jgi:hypothetical protein
MLTRQPAHHTVVVSPEEGDVAIIVTNTTKTARAAMTKTSTTRNAPIAILRELTTRPFAILRSATTTPIERESRWSSE